MGLTDPKLDHPNFRFYKTNIRKSENVQKSFRSFLKESNNQLDVLVNNAGLGYFGKIEDYTDEQIAQMFEANVYGTLYTCREAVPVMKIQQSGHISILPVQLH